METINPPAAPLARGMSKTLGTKLKLVAKTLDECEEYPWDGIGGVVRDTCKTDGYDVMYSLRAVILFMTDCKHGTVLGWEENTLPTLEEARAMAHAAVIFQKNGALAALYDLYETRASVASTNGRLQRSLEEIKCYLKKSPSNTRSHTCQS